MPASCFSLATKRSILKFAWVIAGNSEFQVKQIHIYSDIVPDLLKKQSWCDLLHPCKLIFTEPGTTVTFTDAEEPVTCYDPVITPSLCDWPSGMLKGWGFPLKGGKSCYIKQWIDKAYQQETSYDLLMICLHQGFLEKFVIIISIHFQMGNCSDSSEYLFAWRIWKLAREVDTFLFAQERGHLAEVL